MWHNKEERDQSEKASEKKEKELTLKRAFLTRKDSSKNVHVRLLYFCSFCNHFF